MQFVLSKNTEDSIKHRINVYFNIISGHTKIHTTGNINSIKSMFYKKVYEEFMNTYKIPSAIAKRYAIISVDRYIDICISHFQGKEQ